MNESFDQSVLLALDTKTGELILASDLLIMGEAMLRELRRSSVSDVRPSTVSEIEPRLRCGICLGPVHVSMRRTEFGNRWFAHHGDLTICPFRTKRRMSSDEQMAWQYQGQQEGAEHKRLKSFIAYWLEKEPFCLSVWNDKVLPSNLKAGEWKRPDVRGLVNGLEMVFEIQLAYTFLSEVVRRDTFYRQERVHILWIFREFEPHREVIRDEVFYNRRNIFVLDHGAENETVKRGRLTFKCYYQTPALVGETITEPWTSRYVSLDELNFPEPAYRPYYRDFDLSLLHLMRLRLIRNIIRWGRAKKKRLDLNVVDKLYIHVQKAWRHLEFIGMGGRVESFSEAEFLEQHLPRLLSIKYGKPIGYRFNTVWQVLNSALNLSSVSHQPFNILYLMAVKQYKPWLQHHHAEKINRHREEIRQSIKLNKGESRFIRDTRFDEAIELVFPELREQLNSRFGILEKEWVESTRSY